MPTGRTSASSETAARSTYSLQPGLFGQSLTKIVGSQPGLPPGGKRPALHPKTPCETQPQITDLSTPVAAPPTQIASDLSAPGASLRSRSAAASAIDLFSKQAAQQGLKVNIPKNLFSGK